MPGKRTKFEIFKFNYFFREFSTQIQVFAPIKQLLDNAINGFQVTVFAYGQTGTGKTHTIQGGPDKKDGIV